MSLPTISDEQWTGLLATRAADPGAVAKAYASRPLFTTSVPWWRRSSLAILPKAWQILRVTLCQLPHSLWRFRKTPKKTLLGG